MSRSLLNKALKAFASTDAESVSDSFVPQFVNVGEFNIRYMRREKAYAPTLLLLNGLPQSIRMWESAYDALTEKFDVLAFDIPGFGLSEAKESDMSPHNLS